MTITWTISNLDRRVSDGFVTCAHWRATAVDGAFSSTAYGTRSWTEGTPEIPYDDLTEAQVLAWVWDAGLDKQATEDALQAQINAQKAPIKASGLPW